MKRYVSKRTTQQSIASRMSVRKKERDVFYVWVLDFFDGKVSCIGPFATANSAEAYAEEECDANDQYMISRTRKVVYEQPNANKEEP